VHDIFRAHKILTASRGSIGDPILPEQTTILNGVRVETLGSVIRSQAHRKQVQSHAVSRSLSAAIYFHDLSPGGVERQCLVLARELRERGVDITIVVHQMHGELIPLLPPGIPVVSLDGGRTLQDVLRLRRFLLTERPGVFMANVDHNNIAATLANALSGSATRLVICQHNPLSASYHATVNWKHRVVPWFYGGLSPFIDHAVAVSDGIANELVHQAHLPATKVSTIFNAVIGDDFADRANQPVQHPWLVNKDRPVFVTAGRLVEMKDQRTLLRAFAIHLQAHKARLMILGTGPMLDDLRALADTLGIAEHVEFTGFVPNPLPYMRAANAFVLSSRSEGFGNVLVEALGCGTPVISTDCPYGPGDILARGKYGILVPPQDPKALAPAFSQVIAEADRWPRDMLRARARAFSYSACADAYWNLFRSLV
jgi:glycosyltransferase involved in cell wall biosynthesis